MNRLIKFRAGLRRGFSAAKDGLESKAAERKKVDWAMLKRIACLDKRGTAVVILITWTHTAIYMAIPYFFGEMQKLSNLKLATPEDLAEAERASQAQPPQQAAEAGRPAPEASLLDKIFLKLKDMATRRQTQESAQEPLQKPLAKKELDSQFLTFGTTLVLVNLVAGVLGYLKHVKSKQLENSLAMILKRAIYRDLISRKYDRFLNKSLSPTEIAVKLNSNVSQFTYGLADNMASFVRATLFTGGGSALLFYQLPSFSAMTIGLFGVLFLSSTVFNSLLYESSKSQSDASNKVASYIGDQASNIQSLKILGLQQRSLQMLDKILGFHHKKYMHVANIYGVNIAVLESTHPLRSLRSRRPAAGHPRGLLPDRHWTDSARTHLGRAQHHLRSDRPQRHRQLRQ